MLNKNKYHFVSISDAFDPSNAADDLPEDSSSKWGVVWAEATLLPPGEQKPPIGTLEASTVTYDGPEHPTPQEEEQAPQELPYRNGHFMDIVLGLSLAIAAVVSTIGIELAAAILFVVSSGFYSICTNCQKEGGVLYSFYFIFMPVVVILLFVDAILLAVSVFVAELLGCLAWLVCFLFGGRTTADEWRQYIHRICHLSRWAFRDFHSNWSPQRTPFPFCNSTTVSEERNEVKSCSDNGHPKTDTS